MPQWLCLSLVVPTEGVSPAHQFLSQGRKLLPAAGIQWVQKAPECSALVFAAQSCFRSLNHQQLQKLSLIHI
eukprot:10327100-Prorocentrum_lima.AAC.1